MLSASFGLSVVEYDGSVPNSAAPSKSQTNRARVGEKVGCEGAGSYNTSTLLLLKYFELDALLCTSTVGVTSTRCFTVLAERMRIPPLTTAISVSLTGYDARVRDDSHADNEITECQLAVLHEQRIDILDPLGSYRT
jgi:hypothetical protein